MKKILSIFLSVILILSCVACGKKIQEDGDSINPIDVRIAALKGPTAMGLVKLMQDAPRIEAEGGDDYAFSLAASVDEITPKLVNGELDIACVPANLASVLYNKTEGNIQVLAINTLGVLYIASTDPSIKNIKDLKGSTIVAAGKGSTPEYALRFLLEENGLDPDKDLVLEWKSEHAECVTALATGRASVALLPQPFVSVAESKIEGLQIAIDLTAEWDKLELNSSLLTGVVVARKDFIKVATENTKIFLENYGKSVDWVNVNQKDAANLIDKQGIVVKEIAEKALPYCNIVCITGDEMQEKLSGYLKVLFDANPASVGGKMPLEDFYFK